MNEFKEISPFELKGNIFHEINDEWMLITAENAEGKINTMTASWGGFGIMWGKPVCVCVIRPQRYTAEFVEENEMLSLSFLEEGYREALKLCGTKSGRDCDKIADAGLTPIKLGNIYGFKEAKTVISGKKIYTDVIKEVGFIDKSIIDSKYPHRDYHKVFVCEIDTVYVK